MTTDIETLARRAVACPRWRWMPGMVTATGVRVLRRDEDGYTIGYGPRTSYCLMEVESNALPDLSDPATVGCLLALVREAYNPRGFIVSAVNHGLWWQVGYMAGGEYFTMIPTVHPTEAAALVAALEAAP